ncbi:CsbD family protein [Legionella dresdenensis]|uniref:CsbD family protein n=1 Tax=Legionella dresdenensis TaxID=450200 RepID=A0ABV8CBM2_9GAMM
MSTTGKLIANWDILKGKAKQQWSKLTDDDLLNIKGHRDELIGKLEYYYEYTREEAEREVDRFLG